MTIERSHGKARPTLPRSSDLRVVPSTEPERPGQRDARGRFVSGNGAAIGRGEKAAVRRLLGREGATVSDADARRVALDASQVFGATLRELPSDGATVRQLAAMHARHVALAAFWSARASSEGLGTDGGLRAEEQATKHGQRAERLAVTMLDVATRLAAARPKHGAGLAALAARVGGDR